LNNVASIRLTVPAELNWEIARQKLIESTVGRREKFIYVNAAAGYGKTTLLSQIARSSQNAVWVSLAGENDIFVFLDILCESIRQTFHGVKIGVPGKL